MIQFGYLARVKNTYFLNYRVLKMTRVSTIFRNKKADFGSKKGFFDMDPQEIHIFIFQIL